MRVYAMLVGLALTAGYGYAAQVAVKSVGAHRGEATPAGSIEPNGSLQLVWYGGVLAPITVEAKADAPAKTTAARRLLLGRPGTGCPQPRAPHRTLL